jgi:hypothetical protein
MPVACTACVAPTFTIQTLTFRLGESAWYRFNTSPGNALAFWMSVASLPLGVGEPSSLGILYLEGILDVCRWRWCIQRCTLLYLILHLLRVI